MVEQLYCGYWVKATARSTPSLAQIQTEHQPSVMAEELIGFHLSKANVLSRESGCDVSSALCHGNKNPERGICTDHTHTHTHTCTSILIHTHTHTKTHSAHTQTHTCMSIFIHTHTHTYTPKLTDMHTHTHISIHTHTHQNSQICSHAWTHAHAHTHTRVY